MGGRFIIHHWGFDAVPGDFVAGGAVQIPANALLFMVTLALGWIALCLDRRESSETIRARTRIVE